MLFIRRKNIINFSLYSNIKEFVVFGILACFKGFFGFYPGSNLFNFSKNELDKIFVNASFLVKLIPQTDILIFVKNFIAYNNANLSAKKFLTNMRMSVCG